MKQILNIIALNIRTKGSVRTFCFFSFVHLFLFTFSPLTAQIDSWRAHMAYYEPQQIIKAGSSDLFVRASNSLYRYNLNDHSITTYDKVRQLNDSYITLISWNSATKRLVIVYDNSNIDLLDLNDNVVNMSALYSKSTTLDKTINNIYNHQKYIYLATGFGVVKINVEKVEVNESYILNQNITNVAVQDNTIYARNSNGTVYIGTADNNLIDYHNWTIGTAPDGIFTEDNSAWNEYIATINTLQLDCPKHNYFGFLKYKNNMLFCSSGYSGTIEMPGTVQIYNNNKWTFLQDDMTGVSGTEKPDWRFLNTYAVDIDPLDNKHIFAASRTGLFEYYDGVLKNYFNKDNSMLKSATSSNKYVIVSSLAYDKEGNLWFTQSSVTDNSIIEITKDGEWISHPQELLMDDGKSLSNMMRLYQDSEGYLWFVNNHWKKSSFYCYDPKTDQIISYMVRLVNQDNAAINEMYCPKCIIEDLEGNIWIGTDNGLFMIEKSRKYNQLEYVTQVKVPRNDGTDFADYLLDNVKITDIVVDGGNRKWIGTTGNGIFLISADNMQQLENFTSENSPLLSNNILSLAMNNDTGELFIGTDIGLCSYTTNATTAVETMEKDNVHAYPNPVVSGYDGLITVVGLSLDADVKILSVSGQLVAQGRSNGGTFTWDGCDRSGKRVASGVYMVAAATSDGKKGTVCKIAVIK